MLLVYLWWLIWIHIIFFVSKLIFFNSIVYVIKHKIKFWNKIWNCSPLCGLQCLLTPPVLNAKTRIPNSMRWTNCGASWKFRLCSKFFKFLSTFCEIFTPTNFAESFQEKIFWKGNNYFDKVYWIKLFWIKKNFTVVFSKPLRIESILRNIFILLGWWKGRKLQAHCFLQEIIARKTILHAPT